MNDVNSTTIKIRVNNARAFRIEYYVGLVVVVVMVCQKLSRVRVV